MIKNKPNSKNVDNKESNIAAKFQKKKSLITLIAVIVIIVLVFLLINSGKNRVIYVYEINGVKISKGTYIMFLVQEALELRHEYLNTEKTIDEMTDKEKEEFFNRLDNFWEVKIDGKMPFEIVKENALQKLKAFAYYKRGAQKANITMTKEQRQALETLVENGLINQEMVEADKSNPDKLYLDLFGVTRKEYMDYSADLAINEEFYSRECAKLNVTESELKEYFDENRYLYATNTVYNIFLSFSDCNGNPLSDKEKESKKQLAEQIKKMIEEGHEIEKLVEKYSEADGKEINNGLYRVKRTSAVEESFGIDFIYWSVEANPGDVGIVETDRGISIVKCVEVNGLQENLVDIKEAVRDIKYHEFVEKKIKGSEFEPIVLNEKVLSQIDKVPGSIAY